MLPALYPSQPVSVIIKGCRLGLGVYPPNKFVTKETDLVRIQHLLNDGMRLIAALNCPTLNSQLKRTVWERMATAEVFVLPYASRACD